MPWHLVGGKSKPLDGRQSGRWTCRRKLVGGLRGSQMKLVVAYLEALQEYLSTVSRCWDSVVGILNSLMLSLCLDKLSPQGRRPTRRLYTSPSHVIRINAKDLGSHHRQVLAKPAYLGSAGDKPRSFDNDQATRQIRRHIGALPRPPPPQPRLTCIEFQKGRAKPDGCNVPAPAVSLDEEEEEDVCRHRNPPLRASAWVSAAEAPSEPSPRCPNAGSLEIAMPSTVAQGRMRVCVWC